MKENILWGVLPVQWDNYTKRLKINYPLTDQVKAFVTLTIQSSYQLQSGLKCCSWWKIFFARSEFCRSRNKVSKEIFAWIWQKLFDRPTAADSCESGSAGSSLPLSSIFDGLELTISFSHRLCSSSSRAINFSCSTWEPRSLAVNTSARFLSNEFESFFLFEGFFDLACKRTRIFALFLRQRE